MHTLKPHQIKAAKEAARILRELFVVYIMGEPRIGKSLIALETIAQCAPLLNPKLQGKRALILTRKNAIEGWHKFADHISPPPAITNYEQAHKLNPHEFGIVVIDEAHNFSAFPRPSQRAQRVRRLCDGKPLILLSGTPAIESPNALYSQFALSRYSPFAALKNGYAFFARFGIPNQIYIGNGIKRENYKLGKTDEIMRAVAPYCVKVTFADANLAYNNTDRQIILPCAPSDPLAKYSREATSNGIITHDGAPYPLENAPALRQALHRLCGGFYEGIRLNTPKLAWLREFIAEHRAAKIAIMAYFRQEQDELAALVKALNAPNTRIFSSTRYCEGVDLSGYEHYILYSFGYSGAKFTQLRDRIVNINALARHTTPLIPTTSGAIDEAIYNAVSKKLDFNNALLRDYTHALRAQPRGVLMDFS